MADETANPGGGLYSQPITPAVPDLGGSIGDPLAALHMPSPVVAPPIPNGFPPAIDVNSLAGDFSTGPNPQPRQVTSTKDFVNVVSSAMRDESWAKDKFKYGKTYAYGAGYKNMNFDRYYNHNKFSKIGFNPYRDNEAIYNEKGSWWDDFSRMGSEWIGLALNGAKQSWQSEVESNENMERGNAIGASSKDGVGAWITNFGLNTATTVGIMGELALENIALAGIEMATFGLASPEVGAAALTRNAMGIGRIAKAVEGTAAFLKELKDVKKAKDFFTYARMAETAKGVGQFVNPFARSFEVTRDLIKGTNGFKHLSTKAKMARTFGNYYKDLRELNVAHGEARLEGESAAVQFQNDKIDEFYSKNGYMPDDKESQRIFDEAKSLKASVTLANDMTIYFTNKLAFDELFDGLRPGAKIAQAIQEGSARALTTIPAKMYKAGQTALITASEKGAGVAARDFLFKSSYSPISRKYFLGNMGEAVQENLQEVISKGYTDYYNHIHSDPAQVNYYSKLSSLGKGLSDQFSLEGLNTFMQGYLMGAVIQGGGKLLSKPLEPAGRAASAAAYSMTGGKMGTQWSDKSESELAKEQELKNENDIINAANGVGKQIDLELGALKSDNLTAINTAIGNKNAASDQGDIKQAKDMGNESKINYFHALARSGNMNLVTDHINDMLKLEDKDLADAYDIPVNKAEEARTKLNKFKERAENYQAKYEYAKQKFPNNYNPYMFSARDKDGNLKNPEAYNEEMNGFLAHEQFVADALFATEDFEETARRLSGITTKLSNAQLIRRVGIEAKPGGVTGVELTNLLDATQRADAIKSLQEEIKVLKQGTSEQKKLAAEKEITLNYLKDWNIFVDELGFAIDQDSQSRINPEAKAALLATAGMQPGATVADKVTGETFKVVRTSGRGTVIEDKSGKQKVFKKEKYRLVRDAKGTPVDLAYMPGQDAVSFAIATLYDTYAEYMKHIAKLNKGYVFNEDMNNAFRDIKDFVYLTRDQMRQVNTINRFANPEIQDMYVETLKRVIGIARANRPLNMQRAIKNYTKRKKTNKLLNKIYDIGLFVLPQDIERLQNFEAVDFYDLTAKDNPIIDKNSEKYAQAIAIINEFAPEDKKINIAPPETDTPVTGEKEEEIKTEPPVEKPEVKTKTGEITTLTPVSEMPADLLAKLVEGYRVVSRDNGTAIPAAYADIVASDKFKDFVTTSGTAADIINKYNEPLKTTTTQGVPLGKALSPATINKAVKLGFNKADLDKMTDAEIEQIKTANTADDVKDLLAKYAPPVVTAPEVISTPEPVVKKDKLYNDVMTEYADITNYDEFEAWNERIKDILGTRVLRDEFNDGRPDGTPELNAAYATELAEAKKQFLSKPTADNLVESTIVLTADNKVMIVRENDGKTVTLVSPADFKSNNVAAPTREVPINNIDTDITIVKGKMKVKVEAAPDLTPEQKTESDEAVKNEAEKETTEVKEDLEIAKTLDPSQAKNNLFNSLNNCKIQ